MLVLSSMNEEFPTRAWSRKICMAVAVLTLASGCAPSLPEAGSADSSLYLKECGGCHVAIPPQTLRPAMWEFQVDRMDEIRRAQGLPPMEVTAREKVLAYLVRNAR